MAMVGYPVLFDSFSSPPPSPLSDADDLIEWLETAYIYMAMVDYAARGPLIPCLSPPSFLSDADDLIAWLETASCVHMLRGELPRALLCPSSRPHTLPFLFLPPSPLTDADVPIAWLETAYIHMLRVDVPVPSDFSCVFFLFSLFAFLPSPLTDAEDLIQWLETAYIYMAMVDYPVPSDFLMPLPAHPIRELCRRVDSLPADLLDRIAAGVGVYYNYSGSETCFSVCDTDPHDMSNGWDFQACTEHVMPMSSNASNSIFEPFEWNQTAFEENCLQQYGVASRPTWAMTHTASRSSLFEPFEWNQAAFEQHCLQQYGVAPQPTWAMTQFGG
ncbi:unnamed protein product [Closterium sp. NIES-54]